ncbi:MAG: tetratricopeptide repeat protein [Acidobacteria bacterium]|nr:tetratricopeptide repeat protein [Acidobacteriota bacterium]MCA1649545.1 tetratricopeptide repeat protein [Acidobacteriota bacterium]
MFIPIYNLALMTLLCAWNQTATPEATSLLGKPLTSSAVAADARKLLEENLAKAAADHRRNPDDADAIIWLGRRTAYLGRFREAIDIFGEGIKKHPDDARMYRHRGHRYISVRELERAVADLKRAADLVAQRADDVEPDGQPNARNIPTSTLNSNVYYHLGLAHYLKGDFGAALDAYRECMRFSKNDDMRVATSHWLYMTLRRLDRQGEARQVLETITPSMEIIENASYHKLLLMYKGVEKADALMSAANAGLDAVTIGYGIANWHLYNGRRDQAVEVLRRIVEGQTALWPAFGYIAAEAELARMAR